MRSVNEDNHTKYQKPATDTRSGEIYWERGRRFVAYTSTSSLKVLYFLD